MCHLQSVADDTDELRISLASRLWTSFFVRYKNLLLRKYYFKAWMKKLFKGGIKSKDYATHNNGSDSAIPLKAGDMVRVRSLNEIRENLDKNGKLNGMLFIPDMAQYCGGTYRVFKRVNKIFNTREWKMKKCKDIVLLEGLFCHGYGEFLGCDRSCFFFWKEAWLEKIN